MVPGIGERIHWGITKHIRITECGKKKTGPAAFTSMQDSEFRFVNVDKATYRPPSFKVAISNLGNKQPLYDCISIRNKKLCWLR